MSHRSLKIRRVLILSCGLLSFLTMGCGDGDQSTTDKPAGDSQSGDGEQASSSDTNTSAAETRSSRRQDEVWTDADGNKHLGSVPYDAFFDEPYVVASNNTALNGASPTEVAPVPGGMGTTSPPATATETETVIVTEAAEPAAGAWDEFVSSEVMNSEITEVRNFLGSTLQSVGSYNSSLAMIEPKVASLAVLSAIAIEHPADVSWKEDAHYVRDLAKRMIEVPLQRGKPDQARLQKLYENMADIFNRSRPADLEVPPEDDGFSDAAAMSSVMKRMKHAEQKMRTEAGTESAFTSKKEMIRHEASILRTFTHVIAREEYGYGDDEEFVGFANGIMEAALAIQTATEANDFESYELSLSRISTNCQQCHSVFKNN